MNLEQKSGHHRYGNDIRTEESDDDSQRERCEKLFANPCEQDDGEEDDRRLKGAASTASWTSLPPS